MRNNTRKGRPSPGHQASDVVDPKAFEQKDETATPVDGKATPLTSAPAREKEPSGFEDDAWEVKPSKQPSQARPAPQAPAQPSAPTAPPKPALTGAMAELSLLSPPLQPTPAPQPQPQPAQQPQPVPQISAQATPPPSAAPQTQNAGANPGFFAQLNPQQTGLPQQAGAPQQQFMPPRQRPQPPQNATTSSLIAPPPRPASAPQNVNPQSQFGPPPLQPQVTGIPHAPPGQSLNELNQQRFQQPFTQQQPLQTQPTGFPQQAAGLGPSYPQQIMPQQTGFGQPMPQQQFSNYPQQQQPYINGNQAGSPFADPRPPFQPQPTGFGSFNQSPAPQQPMQTGGINSVLPPALQPQPTGFQPQSQFGQQQQAQQLQAQHTGVNGYGGQQPFNQAPPPVPPLPPMPTQQTPPPLIPQKTGPAPPVRFGVAEPKKLTPQLTGRRANLSQASKFFPFPYHL